MEMRFFVIRFGILVPNSLRLNAQKGTDGSWTKKYANCKDPCNRRLQLSFYSSQSPQPSSASLHSCPSPLTNFLLSTTSSAPKFPYKCGHPGVSQFMSFSNLARFNLRIQSSLKSLNQIPAVIGICTSYQMLLVQNRCKCSTHNKCLLFLISI